jgi:DNA-binding response OmpR family regulator
VANAQRRLLLVDDEENVLVGMRRFFSACGFEVDCASEREQAEALLAEHAYDAMIVDLGLTTGKGPDGLEIVRLGRRICPKARIVVLTAFGSAEMETEARSRGADVFLQKPRPLPEIRRALEAGLRTEVQ